VQSILSTSSDPNTLGKIKRSPSSPAFKKSASVIYEEQIIVDEEEDNPLEFGGPNYSNNEESPGGVRQGHGSVSSGPPPTYFELNSLPSPPPSSPTTNNQPPLNRTSSKIYYRSYMREESICDRSERSNRSSSRRRGTIVGQGVLANNKHRMTDATEGLTFVLSALYAKILVIIGLCFPMAEVISHR